MCVARRRESWCYASKARIFCKTDLARIKISPANYISIAMHKLHDCLYWFIYSCFNPLPLEQHSRRTNEYKVSTRIYFTRPIYKLYINKTVKKLFIKSLLWKKKYNINLIHVFNYMLFFVLQVCINEYLVLIFLRNDGESWVNHFVLLCIYNLIEF